jgi:hypothetical protein
MSPLQSDAAKPDASERTLMRFIPSFLVVDPTLALTRRGQTWMTRADSSSQQRIILPKSLIYGSPYNTSDVAKIYRHGFSGRRSVNEFVNLPLTLRTVSSTGHEDGIACKLSNLNYFIAADCWSGIVRGGILAARRLPTIDQWIEADTSVLLLGKSKYQEKLSTLTELIGASLTSALDRRIRYLAIHAGADSTAIPIGVDVIVYDSGRNSFR